jgi:hypothetical protein
MRRLDRRKVSPRDTLIAGHRCIGVELRDEADVDEEPADRIILDGSLML